MPESNFKEFFRSFGKSLAELPERISAALLELLKSALILVGASYIFLVLIFVIVYFPVIQIDAIIASFPSSPIDNQADFNFFQKIFPIPGEGRPLVLYFGSQEQLLIFFSAISGSIGGTINSLNRIIQMLESQLFFDYSTKVKAWNLTISATTIVLRVAAGAGLGVLVYFLLSSGIFAQLLIPTQITGTETENTQITNYYTVGAISIIAGMFSNRVIKNVGDRFFKDDKDEQHALDPHQTSPSPQDKS